MDIVNMPDIINCETKLTDLVKILRSNRRHNHIY